MTNPIGTLDSYDLARTMVRLRPLGLYGPPSALVARWLEKHTSDAIVAAVERVLATWRGVAQHVSAPETSPGADWRELAAYQEAHQSHHGWTRVTTLLETGEMPADPISMDPMGNALALIPRASGPDDMVALVPEILRRAELGITWAGTQGTEGEELATRKAILADAADKRFLPEWRAFRDGRLLRVLVLGNALDRTRSLGSYSLAGADPTGSLEEWLYWQWHQSQPWGGPKR